MDGANVVHSYPSTVDPTVLRAAQALVGSFAGGLVLLRGGKLGPRMFLPLTFTEIAVDSLLQGSELLSPGTRYTHSAFLHCNLSATAAIFL